LELYDDGLKDDEPHLEFLHPHDNFLIQTHQLTFAHYILSHSSLNGIPLAQDLGDWSSPFLLEHSLLPLPMFQSLTGIKTPISPT
jgi:hypothetical protein